MTLYYHTLLPLILHTLLNNIECISIRINILPQRFIVIGRAISSITPHYYWPRRYQYCRPLSILIRRYWLRRHHCRIYCIDDIDVTSLIIIFWLITLAADAAFAFFFHFIFPPCFSMFSFHYFLIFDYFLFSFFFFRYFFTPFIISCFSFHCFSAVIFAIIFFFLSFMCHAIQRCRERICHAARGAFAYARCACYAARLRAMPAWCDAVTLMMLIITILCRFCFAARYDY